MTRNKVVDLWRKLPTGSDQSTEESLAALSERPEAESRVVSIALRKALAELKLEQRAGARARLLRRADLRGDRGAPEAAGGNAEVANPRRPRPACGTCLARAARRAARRSSMSREMHPSPGRDAAGSCRQPAGSPHGWSSRPISNMCAACRRRVGELAAPGGWWLEQLPSEAPSPRALGAAGAPGCRAGSRPIRSPPACRCRSRLRQELAGQRKPRWWSILLNGGRVSVLLEDTVTKSLLCLGEMPGGRRFPRHEPLGFEQVMVLAGGYADERGEFVAGDYAVLRAGLGCMVPTPSTAMLAGSSSGWTARCASPAGGAGCSGSSASRRRSGARLGAPGTGPAARPLC